MELHDSDDDVNGVGRGDLNFLPAVLYPLDPINDRRRGQLEGKALVQQLKLPQLSFPVGVDVFPGPRTGLLFVP